MLCFYAGSKNNKNVFEVGHGHLNLKPDMLPSEKLFKPGIWNSCSYIIFYYDITRSHEKLNIFFFGRIVTYPHYRKYCLDNWVLKKKNLQNQ